MDTRSGSTVITTEAWVHSDGSGVTRTSSDFVATGPGEPLGSPLAPRQQPVAAGNFVLFPDTYAAIRALATTPEQLLDQLHSVYSVGDEPGSVVEFLGKLIALEITPPAVRQAGFEVLAQLGAQPIGPVTTTEGVVGVGYQGLDAYGLPWIMVVDPGTTAVLAYAVRAGTGANTFFDADRWNEYISQQIEDGLPN